MDVLMDIVIGVVLYLALKTFLGLLVDLFVAKHKAEINKIRQQYEEESSDKAIQSKHEVRAGEEQTYPVELPDGVHSLKFEVLPEHDGLILCLDTDNNFICQGKTMEEVQDNFRKRFPQDAAVIIDPDAKALYQEMMQQHDSP